MKVKVGDIIVIGGDSRDEIVKWAEYQEIGLYSGFVVKEVTKDGCCVSGTSIVVNEDNVHKVFESKASYLQWLLAEAVSDNGRYDDIEYVDYLRKYVDSLEDNINCKDRLDSLPIYESEYYNHIRIDDSFCISDSELDKYVNSREDISFVLRKQSGSVRLGHITDVCNIASIVSDGFKIPDEEDVARACHFGLGVYFCNLQTVEGWESLKSFALTRYYDDEDDFADDEYVTGVIEVKYTGEYCVCVASKENLKYAKGYVFIENIDGISVEETTDLLHNDDEIAQFFDGKVKEL